VGLLSYTALRAPRPGSPNSLVVLASQPAKAPAQKSPAIDFSRDIRPILSNNCFACHGPDENSRKAALRLDTQAGSRAPTKSGGIAIVPGRTDQSRLIERINAADRSRQMPPPESGKTLSERERDLLSQWISEGAEYAPHWALRPIRRPSLPAVSNESWPRNDIDRFVLARLDSEGLAPSPEADKRTLIRRVSLDLTGIPPTPSEVESFVADQSPDAYERLVDRLLESPRYGERMALEWLDSARYADTNGYHIDNERFMWRWRDWVIDAFNANMPFDQFTVEQIAGDLLPDATDSQRTASGFNRNHNINFEGGAIPEEYRTAYVIDRVNTTSTVWLGLTMGCAQCHDHKYDPISTVDFYRFYAFFNNVDEIGLDGNAGNAAPSMLAPLPGQKEKLAELEAHARDIRAQMDAPNPAIDEAMQRWHSEQEASYANLWTSIPIETASSTDSATTLTLQPDGSALASGTAPATESYTFTLRPQVPQPVVALRLEALADASLPVSGPGRFTNGNFVLTEFEADVVASDGTSTPVKFAAAYTDYTQPNFPVANAIDGNAESGWAVQSQVMGQDRVAVFVAAVPVEFPDASTLTVRLKFTSQFAQHSIGRPRISFCTNAELHAGLLPSVVSDWSVSEPFEAGKDEVFEKVFAPEEELASATADSEKFSQWAARPEFSGPALHPFPDGAQPSAIYLTRTISSPNARKVTLALGSDDGIKVWLNGQLVHSNPVARALAADQDSVTIDLPAGSSRVLIKVVNYGGGFGFAYRHATDGGFALPLDIQRLVTTAVAQRTEEQSKILRGYYRQNFDPQWAQLNMQAKEADDETAKYKASIPTVMVMGERMESRKTTRLVRGQYDQPAEEVTPGIPAVLGSLPSDQPANRLSLARWLVAPENPLTARVAVNRFWQTLMGTGLVKTSEDFGVQGQWPSHPELLDWLASEFRDQGWDIKRFLRLVVTSATYRQRAIIPTQLLERDPENRLLARMPRVRLTAEGVRDNALAVSGLLVERLGGPSVRIYQPKGLWEELAIDPTGASFSAQVYKQDTGDSLYRRSLYLFRKRTVSHPAMAVFDAPSHEYCVVRRSRTNTPLQALVLMNDPTFVESARFLAQRLLLDKPALSDSQRISYAYELALARPARSEETSILLPILVTQRDRFAADPGAADALLAVGEKPRDPALPAPELAAWTTIASTILNLDEAITRE